MAELSLKRPALLEGRTGRALLLTLVLLALRIPLGMLLDLLPGGDDPAIFYARLIVQAMLLWGLPSLLMRPWRSARLPENARCLWGCIGAVILGAFSQLMLRPVTAWWAEWTGCALTPLMTPENEIQWILAVLALCVTPALCEETYFRGGVLPGLLGSGTKWAALVISSLLFALMHGSLAGLPAHLVVSVLAGVCMLRWGRLRVSVLFHLGYNAAVFLPQLPLSMGTSAALALLLAGCALWMCGKIDWYSRRMRLSWPERLLALGTLLAAGMLYLPELI